MWNSRLIFEVIVEDLFSLYFAVIILFPFYLFWKRLKYKSDAAALKVVERKILRKTFGPVWVGDDFSIRLNSELYEFLSDIDVVHRINI